jgi:hypothetical protein
MTNKPSDSGRDPSSSVDLAESVAGEEDPGAAIDLDERAMTSPTKPMSPGDEAPVGAPGTGEKDCPDCGGTGRRAGSACPTCQGTGKVNAGVGGG